MEKSLFTIILILVTIAVQATDAQPFPTELGAMQTAHTLGKGGYITSIGVTQYEKENISETKQDVIIGNFEELRILELLANVKLIPIRLTYGIGDHLDLILGGTLASGEAKKIVRDFYNTGDMHRDRRAYNQPVFETIIGMKYNIKPDVGDGLPTISVGGEFQTGFTIDHTIDKKFSDTSPADGASFLGVIPYMAITQPVMPDFHMHAVIGSHFFSNLNFFWQIGGELELNEKIWVLGNYSNRIITNGIEIKRPTGFGLRYNLSDQASLSVNFTTAPGIQFNLMLGGLSKRITIPKGPAEDDFDLPF
ncbi:TPA: hypothetical protein EYN98_17935 [Candidatus Poribacteria bacterium]|jgi:hypothetical protein|nr:hypothetical protein [Candidatus Poribacteria bacterium]HIB89588.1 hypothetical protein [Candidatus Poribacteria bacterium]HIC00937.1 hypothetical protein [Candidatus Poribacteria bacterium]HIN30169.1 hypothetical protein [Candidatus Poribacteria bacterium]HIO45893.1 hypothetical protein [Candidatus Poribacteria bacterium]